MTDMSHQRRTMPQEMILIAAGLASAWVLQSLDSHHIIAIGGSFILGAGLLQGIVAWRVPQHQGARDGRPSDSAETHP